MTRRDAYGLEGLTPSSLNRPPHRARLEVWPFGVVVGGRVKPVRLGAATMEDSTFPRVNRRQAVRLIAAGGVGLLAAGRTSGDLLAAPRRAVSGERQVSFPEGAVIRTIFSDLPPDALAQGTTLFHEHLDGVYSHEIRQLQLQLPPPSSANIAPVISDIEEAMKNGVICIVDGGHPDMGVNYEHLRQISTETGLHVVASGGYYLRNTYPAEISTMTEDQIVARLVAEANAGRFGAYGEIGNMAGRADFFFRRDQGFPRRR